MLFAQLDIKTAILDIETDGVGDIENQVYPKLKWIGLYDCLNDQFHYYKYPNFSGCKELIEQFEFVFTYNGDLFDIPVLEHNGIVESQTRFNRVFFKFKHIDLRKVCKNKQKLDDLGVKVEKYKLKTIAETLGFSTLKGEIDYEIFAKDEWTKSEEKHIIDYIEADLVVTYKLLIYLYNNLKTIKDFLPPKRGFEILTNKAPTLGYYALCNLTNIKPTWDNETETQKTKGGGLQIEPRKRYAKGKIVLFDFASAYPNAIISHNLFDRIGVRDKPTGYLDKQGIYNTKELSPLTKSLKILLERRLYAKHNNLRELNLASKILINSIYGTLGNPKYEVVYDPIARKDCTAIVRQWLRHICCVLEAMGCEVLYGHTDSLAVFIDDNLSINFVQSVINKEVDMLNKMAPFPQPTVKMGLEKIYKLMFVKAKGNYIAVTDDDKIILKGAWDGLKTKNTPPIVQIIWDEYCTPKILKNLSFSFSKQEIVEQIIKIVEKDITLCFEKVSIKRDKYKKDSSQQSKILKKYGKGEHLLISNNKGIGVPIGDIKNNRARCTLHDFKLNKLTSKDVDTTKLVSPFKGFFLIPKQIEKGEIK